MRRLLSYGLLLLCLLACSREAMEPEWDGPVIELRLDCEDGPDSKAGYSGTQEGVNAYRENLIESVDFYFYPGNATDEDATYHYREDDLQIRGGETFLLTMTTHQVNTLIFPVQPTETTYATVFALVNVPKAALEALPDSRLSTLMAMEQTSNFAASANYRQSNFIMSKKEVIHLSSRSQKKVADGLIKLERYASKITVGIKVEENVVIEKKVDDQTTDQEIWRPMLEEMRIYLDGGVNTVALSGLPAGTPGGAVFDQDNDYYFSYGDHPLYFLHNTGTDANPVYEPIFDKSGDYYNTYPMYTYPHRWTDGVGETTEKDREPFLKLILPWKKGEGASAVIRPFYYKILIPKDARGEDFENQFVRNNWYHYDIYVGMLGAETEEGSALVTPINFYIYFWQNKEFEVKQAIVGSARYLSVEKQYDEKDENPEFYTINNQNELDVHYTSSNPISYTVNSVTRPYYGSQKANANINNPTLVETLGAYLRKAGDGGNTWADKIYPEGLLYLDYVYESDNDKLINTKDWFSDIGSAIHLDHPLINDYTKDNYDYSPYTIFLSVAHADGGLGQSYAKVVKIVQNPGMFITAEENSDPLIPTYSGWDTENSSNPVWLDFEHNGFVFVDAQRRWRHKTAKNDDGEYGKSAKTIKSDWGNSSGAAGEVRQKLEWLQWRTVHFSGGNRNMYTITVTVLPPARESGGKTVEYTVGDPRTLTPETWNNGYENSAPKNRRSSAPYDYYNYINYWHVTWDSNGENAHVDSENYEIEFEWAPPIDNPDGPKQPLTHYYPAEESERTRNMIAPSIRVASRFGGLEFYDGVTHQSAKFKCATYQEDGFPAGRWRLPTEAEIVFISSLNSYGDFVRLFTPTSKYWSANGAVQPDSGPIANQTFALVRCVYDAWYWDQMPEEYRRLPAGKDADGKWYRDTYVFGDLPR
ncbi:MAG: hypothetical protein J5669_03875 [Bacteroidales bacterium]|nr:hypothetical protein [Bacteroidales bacterium]